MSHFPIKCSTRKYEFWVEKNSDVNRETLKSRFELEQIQFSTQIFLYLNIFM